MKTKTRTKTKRTSRTLTATKPKLRTKTPPKVSESPLWARYSEFYDAMAAHFDACRKCNDIHQALERSSEAEAPHLRDLLAAAEAEEVEANSALDAAELALSAQQLPALPDLVGSPQQVVEATEKRAEWLEAFGSVLLESISLDTPGRAVGIGTLIDMYAAKTDARWWIWISEDDPELISTLSVLERLESEELGAGIWFELIDYARESLSKFEAEPVAALVTDEQRIGDRAYLSYLRGRLAALQPEADPGQTAHAHHMGQEDQFPVVGYCYALGLRTAGRPLIATPQELLDSVWSEVMTDEPRRGSSRGPRPKASHAGLTPSALASCSTVSIAGSRPPSAERTVPSVRSARRATSRMDTPSAARAASTRAASASHRTPGSTGSAASPKP